LTEALSDTVLPEVEQEPMQSEAFVLKSRISEGRDRSRSRSKSPRRLEEQDDRQQYRQRDRSPVSSETICFRSPRLTFPCAVSTASWSQVSFASKVSFPFSHRKIAQSPSTQDLRSAQSNSVVCKRAISTLPSCLSNSCCNTLIRAVTTILSVLLRGTPSQLLHESSRSRSKINVDPRSFLQILSIRCPCLGLLRFESIYVSSGDSSQVRRQSFGEHSR